MLNVMMNCPTALPDTCELELWDVDAITVKRKVLDYRHNPIAPAISLCDMVMYKEFRDYKEQVLYLIPLELLNSGIVDVMYCPEPEHGFEGWQASLRYAAKQIGMPVCETLEELEKAMAVPTIRERMQ